MAEEVKTAAAEGESGSKNFIDAFIEEDIAEGGRFQGQQVHLSLIHISEPTRPY